MGVEFINEKWYRVVFKNAKTHHFPGCIGGRVLSNLTGRGCIVYEDFFYGAIKEVSEVGVSLGAPCMTDTSWSYFDLPGAQFGVETRELDYFLDKLKSLKERMEFGFPYYKLHGRLHCVCLLPEHRSFLIEKMEKYLPEALAIAEVENKKFNEVLSKVSGHAIHRRAVQGEGVIN